tara:strand:- start:146 stop:2389 length:2244 start_codon:yes stop_codon:yes gene_type:complete
MASLNINDINKQIQLLRKELGKVAKADFLAKNIAEANKELVKLRGEIQDVNNELSYFSDSFKGSLSELTKTNFELSLAKKSFKGLVSIADQYNQINLKGTKINKKKLDALKAQGEQEFKNLEYAKRYGDFKNDPGALDAINSAIAQQSKFNEGLEDTVKFQERLNDSSGVKTFGFLSDISKAIPGMSTLTSMFDDASAAAKDTQFAMEKQRELDIAALKSGKGVTKDMTDRLGVTDKINFTKKGTANQKDLKGLLGKDGKGLDSVISKGTAKLPKGMSSMMAGVKSLGPALTKALGPIGLIIELVQGLLKADAQATKLQKTMMMSSSEANSFNQGLQQAAMRTGDIAITGTKVFETFMSINKELGFIAKFSKDTLGSATKLQQVLGISESSTANLAAASVATGTSLESNYENILGSSYQLQMQSKTQLDMKSVIEATGKVTGQIRANMGGNVVEIAKAVTQAKLLGTNLESVAAAGKQLLNFEQSISAEMNAELLTGRALNLERARAAALSGNQAVLAEELAKNMGDFTSFTKLNVIQQDALAAAMGMQSNEVSDMLFKQETMNKSAEELRALGKGELADRMEAKSTQDKMNAAMEQLKQTFVQLGTTLLPIFKLLGFVAGIFSVIIGYTQDLIGFIGNIFGIGDFAKVEDSAGTNAFKSAFGGGGGMEIQDGVISPDGEIITTSPADYLIATKDPGALASSIGDGNNGETNNLLKRLISVVEAGGDVILDGNKVGRNLALASSGIG